MDSTSTQILQAHTLANRQTETHSTDCSRTEQEIEEIITETLWSIPDTTGKQYPMRTTQTTRRTIHNRQHQHIAMQETVQQQNEQTNTTTYQQSHQQKHTDTNTTATTKTTTPTWLIALILCIVAAALLVGWILLKHYRIL
ncbi:MAG: hypothetical protein NC199_05610 [Bacteroides sp.]|nr:hypothetical protein [Bacteroides sp.]